MIISIPKLVVGLALVFVAGCGSEADMMGATGAMADADVAAQVDGGGTGGSVGMVDAGAGKADVLVAATGGTAGTATGTGGAGGSASGATGGAPGAGGSAMGGASGTGGAPASTYMYCPQFPDFNRTKPGFLNKDLTWTSRWKDGYACAICTEGKAMPKQVVGCLVKYSVELDGPDPLLCVQSQAECCFKVTTTCERDSDCCSPLKCQDNGAGKSKTCR